MKPKILLVGGGMLQLPAVKIAKSMGLEVYVTDQNPECACLGYAHEIIEVDTRNHEAHKEVAKSLKNLVAVFTQGHSVEMAVACGAAAVSLPGLGPDTALRISNKAESRLVLAEKGLPQPNFVVLETGDSLEGLSIFGNEPVILKATDSSGSRGLVKLDDPSQITSDLLRSTASFSTDGRVIVEERIKGISEQSVETLWFEGKGYWLNWVDRPFLKNNSYAIEIGHYNPALQSGKVQRRTERMVLTAGRALGMTTGIFKCDVMQTEEETYILETTARLSGGFDAQYTSPLAHGVSYIRGAMELALGEAPNFRHFLPKQYYHAVALGKIPSESGVLKRISTDEVPKDWMEQVLYFSRYKSGDGIKVPENCAQRPVFVIAVGSNRALAIEKASRVLDRVKIELE